MRHKVELRIAFADRSIHQHFLHVDADGGNDAATKAQEAFKTDEFNQKHGKHIGSVSVVGIEQDPEPIETDPEDEAKQKKIEDAPTPDARQVRADVLSRIDADAALNTKPKKATGKVA